jgi:hypothetical protein
MNIFLLARVVIDQFDVDNDSSVVDRRYEGNSSDGSRTYEFIDKQHDKSILGEMGFFTDTIHVEQHSQHPPIRNLFQKVAMGVVFLMTIKHRAMKNRLVRHVANTTECSKTRNLVRDRLSSLFLFRLVSINRRL